MSPPKTLLLGLILYLSSLGVSLPAHDALRPRNPPDTENVVPDPHEVTVRSELNTDNVVPGPGEVTTRSVGEAIGSRL
jgi:hypothetical protein